MEKANAEEPPNEEVDVSKTEEEKKEKEKELKAKAEKEKEEKEETAAGASSSQKKKKKDSKCKKHADKKKKKASKSSKRSKRRSSTSDDSDSDVTDDSDSDSESAESDSDSSSSEDEKERAKKKRKARAKRKAAQKKKKEKAKKHKKSKKHDSSDDSSSSDSDSSDAETESDSSEEEQTSKKRRSGTKTKRATVKYDTSTEAEETTNEETWEAEADTAARLQEQLNALHLAIQARQVRAARTKARVVEKGDPVVVVERSRSRKKGKDKKEKKEKEKEKKGKKGDSLEFKRVDELWDSNIHDWKLRESAEEQEDQFDQCVFTVRRRFNWENKYRDTVVDIKSKLLREALQTIMKDVKSVSLVEEEPCIDPNTLFLYLEETRTYYKKTIKTMIKKTKKKKLLKRLKQIRAHVKVLMDYLDEDYGETKKKLYPLLEAGNITFDLLWALFKPNTLAYTTTYGSLDDPRCFKVDYAYKEQSFIRGEWYSIEGRYLEYDGKHFGLGDFSINVDSFKGPRKITSLATYPLQYHKEPEKVKEQLVERGKKFVMMQGMNYKFHKGLAFVKKKKAVAKVTINGRVMIDPAIFRRINPNYPISVIKPKEAGELMSDDDEDCSECGCDDSSDEAAGGNVYSKDKEDQPQKMAWKIIWDKDNKPMFVRVPVDEDGQIIKPEKLEQLTNGEEKDNAKTPQVFSEEELLIASPVVLGFSFKEKLWLEFSLSGIKEIDWNEGAFESLVLPTNQKSIVKALVSSHKFHAAETIDDVIQGKGKGLVFVLHGPPGVGKTLTGEGIAEMLRCPLYAVSAGELGMDQRNIEHELQKIMDIAHSWGAVLLLDEADVFLEKRQIQDVGRNAMVSIFLRLLEYFQGILFLTTNRVETFDEAFQSRIHVALKYEELGHKAKKEIWKTFLDKVKEMEGTDKTSFSERDFEQLARNNLNGRQIKNAVRTAQALAVNERQKLSMEHIERVLAVAESFDRDMRGLTPDAMKQYL
ncbi:hypothetical protein NA57DRAFT_34333 [Rhizodiscina lignyota]|uniref:AAA+ ATPase domain-containing protein n=1 Tax=Rhizodiscina lignyota TaxID=1504668 RepID=A0A9P4II51_9PEZI|nr:hypothetical protein NA57DRAFT_34333 [Rhizodiscina lignyota]